MDECIIILNRVFYGIDDVVAEAEIRLKLNPALKELVDRYQYVWKRRRELLDEIFMLEEKIAKKHGGKWAATYKDGSVLIVKGFFKKKHVKVYDEKLSPQLVEKTKEYDQLDEEFYTLEKMLKDYIRKAISHGEQ